MKLYIKEIKPVWRYRSGQGYTSEQLNAERPEKWYPESMKEKLIDDIFKHPKIVKGSIAYDLNMASEALRIQQEYPNIIKRPYSDAVLEFEERYIEFISQSEQPS